MVTRYTELNQVGADDFGPESYLGTPLSSFQNPAKAQPKQNHDLQTNLPPYSHHPSQERVSRKEKHMLKKFITRLMQDLSVPGYDVSSSPVQFVTIN